MPSSKLTEAQCKGAKALEKPYKLFDGGGLYLEVSPAGGRSWRLQYRIEGKPQTLTLGKYPLLGLRDARDKALAAKSSIAQGMRPVPKKSALTLRQACEAYWHGREDVSAMYRRDAINALDSHVLRDVGAKRVGQVTDDDLLGPLIAMDKAGRSPYARKVRTWLCQVFDWAVATKQASTNPARSIQPRHAFRRVPVKHFKALPLSAVGKFLRDIRARKGASVHACRLLMLTWARTNEVIKMRWAEIDGDVWTVPESRMKRRKAHVVPLPRQAVEILDQLRIFARSEFVFTHPSDHDKPMSTNAILALIKKTGYKGQTTGHGFRSMASTWANERGFSPDVIEIQLSHVPEDRVRAAYNRADYFNQRKALAQAWADWLDQEELGSPSAKSTASSRPA